MQTGEAVHDGCPVRVFQYRAAPFGVSVRVDIGRNLLLTVRLETGKGDIASFRFLVSKQFAIASVGPLGLGMRDVMYVHAVCFALIEIP